MGIPPNPWTQKSFLVALEAYYAEKEARTKKEETLTMKKGESKKNEETSPTVHFVPPDQKAT